MVDVSGSLSFLLCNPKTGHKISMAGPKVITIQRNIWNKKKIFSMAFTWVKKNIFNKHINHLFPGQIKWTRWQFLNQSVTKSLALSCFRVWVAFNVLCINSCLYSINYVFIIFIIIIIPVVSFFPVLHKRKWMVSDVLKILLSSHCYYMLDNTIWKQNLLV